MGILTSLPLRAGPIALCALFGASGCSSLADDCDNLLCAPENCEPTASSGPVGGLCGVFVSSETGDDATGNGSQQSPFKTLGAALSARGDKPIYACAGPAYEESIEIPSSLTLYGGLDCGSWAYAGLERRSEIVAPPDAIAVSVRGADAIVRVEDFDIAASDGATPGASSVAMLVDAATVSLARVALSAGDAAGGASVPHAEDQAANGAAGQGGLTGCVTPAIAVDGGAGGVHSCDGTDVSGGDGGEGKFSVTGGNGDKGKPVAEVGGASGIGATGSTACTNGGLGSGGDSGDDGLGAVGSATVFATGYIGVAGMPGQHGTPGQGGGGGGGGGTCNGNAGPSGGGGGAGGCGGLGGPGGGFGGASIPLISLEAVVTLVEVALRAGNGGKGGDGQPGQLGGAGGTRGFAGGLAACDGGQGGGGGVGGAGGGGMGGPSIGIAYTGAPPQEPGTVTTALGTPGEGGLSGDGSQDPPGAGVAGITAERQKL